MERIRDDTQKVNIQHSTFNIQKNENLENNSSDSHQHTDRYRYYARSNELHGINRFFVNEIIREKILLYYDKEIPYSVEVVVEQFKEDAKKIHIHAVIYVERDSQKGIIIGKQGKALKKVATEARRDLERFFGKTVFLETYVKVDKDWRSSDKELRNFGYQLD